MAKNQVREVGRHLVVTPTNGGATSGAPGRIGERCGVAEVDVVSGQTTMDFDGVYSLSVAGLDGGGNSAVVSGDIIYYVDADTPKLSKKATGRRFGYAYAPTGATLVAGGATGTIDVKIGY